MAAGRLERRWPLHHRETRFLSVQLLQREAPRPHHQPSPPKTTATHGVPAARRPIPKSSPLPQTPAPMPEQANPIPETAIPPPLETVSGATGETGPSPPGPIAEKAEAATVLSAGAAETQPEQIREASPRYDINPAPPYPSQARRRGYQGTVMLHVLVTASGTVADARLLQSSGYSLLDRSAMTAIWQWVFQPGTRNGRPVDMQINVPIVFQLR